MDTSNKPTETKWKHNYTIKNKAAFKKQPGPIWVCDVTKMKKTKNISAILILVASGGFLV